MGEVYCARDTRQVAFDSCVTIYGNHIDKTQKTTVYLDADDYRRLKALARRRGRPPAQLVREAVAEYTARHMTSRAPKSVGGFASARGDVGRRAEELLAGMGRAR